MRFSPLLALAAFGLPLLALAQQDEITYNGDVARIINENCVICHQEGGIDPMQFENYDQVRPWAPLIQFRVANREMPPYAYDHGIGLQQLKGDWRLSQEDIDTIVAWVDQGAPQGDPEVVPPTPDLPDPDDWNFERDLGPPDLIVPSIPIDIPATGNDIWSKHYVSTPLTTDRCIKAVQVRSPRVTPRPWCTTPIPMSKRRTRKVNTSDSAS